MQTGEEAMKRLGDLKKKHKWALAVIAARTALRHLPLTLHASLPWQPVSSGPSKSFDSLPYYLLNSFACLKLVLSYVHTDDLNPAEHIPEDVSKTLEDLGREVKTFSVFARGGDYTDDYTSIDGSLVSLADDDVTNAAVIANATLTAYGTEIHVPAKIEAVTSDVAFIERGHTPQELIEKPLWLVEPPEWFSNAFSKLTSEVNNFQKKNKNNNNNKQGDVLASMLEQYASFLEGKKQTSTPKISTVPETAAGIDHLDRQALVNAMATLISSEKATHHLTIGLLGHWGAGKTYVLDLLKEKLQKQACKNSKDKGNTGTQFLFGEFNAWAYEHSDNIQAAMAHEVIKSLTSLQSLKTYDASECEGCIKRVFWRYLNYVMLILCNFVKKILWTVFIRPYITLDFVVRKAPVRVCLFLASTYIFYFSIHDFDFTDESFWKSITQTDMLISGGSITLALSFLTRLRTVFMQSSTKEFLTYVKLPGYAKHIGQVSEMRKDIELMCDLRLCIEDKDNTHWLSKWRTLSKRKRLLFVVDDLDRCGPDGIVKTFEAIRLVLEIPQVTVVIAVDQRIALAALALHHEKLEKHHSTGDAKYIARDYFGKMIHLPIVLQTPEKTEAMGYMAHVWNDTDPEAWMNVRPNPPPEAEKPDEGNIDTGGSDTAIDPQVLIDETIKIIGVVSPSTDVSGLTIDQKHAFIEWTDFFKIRNPRQLKRLDNSYNLLRLVIGRKDKELTTANGAKAYGLMVALLGLEFINSLENTKLRVEYRKRLLDPNPPSTEKSTKVSSSDSESETKLQELINIIDQYAATQSHAKDKILDTREKVFKAVDLYVLPAID